MSHPLEGCWAKIERANHNIDRLYALITPFLHLHGYNFVTDVNDEKTEYVLRVLGPPRPPPEFSVRTGEIIHHLRSSLDHLVWALVLRHHKSPEFKVQFPICDTVAKYKKAIRDGIIEGVSGNARTIIERAQPYHAAKPCDDPLAILHDLNKIDKHKLLLVVSSYTYIPDTISISGDKVEHDEIEFIPENWSKRMVRAIEGGAELFRIRFARPVKVGMYAQLAPYIAFEKFGVRHDEPIIPGLTSLRDAVVKTIKLFDSEF